MKKILIIQTAFPGDAILTLPMIQKLASREKDQIIDVLAIPSTEEIFKASPCINNVIVYDKKRKDKSIFSVFGIAKKIKAENYDTLISPHRSFRSSLIVLLSRIKDTYGFNISSFSWVYKHQIKYISNIHEVQRNLRLINEDETEWRITPEVKSVDVGEILSGLIHRSKIIAIAPGSIWETKKYPKEHFKKLIEQLIPNYSVVLIGGKDDQELCEFINLSPNKFTLNLAGKLSIVQSISLLKKCNLLISNDSAPTHMGMAANIPVLTIYCSTVPGFGFYPYNSKSRILSYNDLKCKPCGIHGHNSCPEKTFDCGLLLQPEEVLKELKTMMDY